MSNESPMQTSRRLRALLLLGAMLVAFMRPALSPAFDGAGCAKSWNEPNSQGQYLNMVSPGSGKCTFLANGTPIQFSGEASALKTNQNVQIRVWVSPAGTPQTVLAECGKTDTGWVGCGGEFTLLAVDARRPALVPGSNVTLQCNWTWTGNREGGAGCFTPEPCPQIGQLGCLKVLGVPVDCWARLDSCPRPHSSRAEEVLS